LFCCCSCLHLEKQALSWSWDIICSLCSLQWVWHVVIAFY
jgi:hypothetical protein